MLFITKAKCRTFYVIFETLMKIFKVLFSLYAMTVFVALMLIIFILALPTIFMRQVAAGKYVYWLCSFWSDIWFFLIFIRTKKIDIRLFNKDEKYIIVPNHISYLDIPVLVNVFRKPVRPLGKEEMVRIPLFGFLYRKVAVTVDRSSPENRTKSVITLKSIINNGISILVFPEGTFNMTDQPLKEFYNGAFRVAIETQTPIKPVLFLDTFDRMHYGSVFSITPGKCRVVYLPDIQVERLTADDVEALKKKTFDSMWQKLIEYNATWICKTPD